MLGSSHVWQDCREANIIWWLVKIVWQLSWLYQHHDQQEASLGMTDCTCNNGGHGVSLSCTNTTPCLQYCSSSITMDQIDAIGHWAGNMQQEIYADKIPKTVSYLFIFFLVHCTHTLFFPVTGHYCTCWLLCWWSLLHAMGWGPCSGGSPAPNIPICWGWAEPLTNHRWKVESGDC